VTIAGVGHLTALAFVAAIDEPDRFRSSRDVGPYLGACAQVLEIRGDWLHGLHSAFADLKLPISANVTMRAITPAARA